MRQKGFTLIELIVVIAVVGILVALGTGVYKGYTKEARRVELLNNIKVIEQASEQYYMKNNKWPKLSEENYTKDDLNSLAKDVYDINGNLVELDPEGKYYDINYTELVGYARLRSPKYILQNPVGKVYYLDKITKLGVERETLLSQGITNIKSTLEVPEIILGEYITEPTYDPITVTATVSRGNLNKNTYTFMENGEFTFILTTPEGKETRKTIRIDNIISTKEFNLESLNINNITETLKIDNLNNIYKVLVDNGEFKFGSSGEYVTINITNADITETTNNPNKFTKEVTSNITSETNLFSETTEYTDEEGYLGTLTKNGESVIKSGEHITEQSKTVTQKVTPQISTTFATSIIYDQDGFTGTLNKNGAHYQDGSITETKEVTSSETNSTNSFSSTKSYNQDNFIGTLNKLGASTVQSGIYTPVHSKEVVAQTSSNYNQDGYLGTLEQYVYSGTYTPSESKTETITIGPQTSTTFSETQNYSSGGFVGTLSKSGGMTTNTTYYYDKYNSIAVSSYGLKQTKTSSYLGFGGAQQRIYPTYTQSQVTGVFSVGGAYGTSSPGYVIQGGNYSRLYYITSLKYMGYDEGYEYYGHMYEPVVQTTYSKGSLVQSNIVAGSGTYPTNGRHTDGYWYVGRTESTYSQNYSGTVTKPASDTRIYRYKGTVTKPASDTRIWQQNYSGEVTKTIPLYSQNYAGTVTKQGLDTRIWEQEYTGIVNKAGIDDKYKYNITVEYFKK